MSSNDGQHNTGESLSELQDTVELLAQEVHVLREVIDEIREDFRWAVQNGCLTAGDETVPESYDRNFLKSARPETDSGGKEGSTEDVDQQCDSSAEHSSEEPAGSVIAGDLDERLQQHEEWAATVRDPAKETSEGVRMLQTKDRGASAEYEIAPLPSDRWALRTDLRYHVGDLRGNSTPWAEYESREACVDQFIDRAKKFFSADIDAGGSDSQRHTRNEMLKHFETSLFGFVEPDVVLQEKDPVDSSSDEHSVEDNLLTLKRRILEYLSACVGSVNLSDIRSDMGFTEIDSTAPLANPVHRVLVALQKSGNVSLVETEFGEPGFLFQRPLFLRPDRQDNFEGTPFYHWPDPDEDRNTLTVDRVGDHVDGGEHRFTVKRGDTVEAFFSRDKQEIGKVVGISHANREVRVSFREGSEGTWFAIGSIYPAVESVSDDVFPLSEVIEKANTQNTPQEKEETEINRVSSSNLDSGETPSRDSHGKGVESLTEHHRPYQFDDFQAFLQRLDSGDLSASELQADFSRLNSSREALIAELLADKNAKALQVLAYRFGCLDARRNTKQQNGEAIIRSMSLAYTLKNIVTYQPFSGESYEDAIRKVVESLTDEDIQQYVQERKATIEQSEKSLTNPETLAEFRYFIDRKGESHLSHEQLIQYDRLRAEQTRLQRANKKPTTVEQFSGDLLGLEITIKEGFHTRQNIPLWICQLNERVDRATFSDLKFKAKQLGGWWSSFKKDDAGFQFKYEESAQKFQSLLHGNADRSDELADRKTRKIETASERLLQLADDLEQNANESLQQDRQTNTVRRSEMAAGIRGRAYVDIAFAGTLRSLSTALASGEAIYLDGIRTKTQLATLIAVLRRAKRKRNDLLLSEKGEMGIWDRHNAVEELDHRPMDIEDADFTEFPYPNIYKRNFTDVIARAVNRKGVKQRAQRMKKWIPAEGDFIQFKEDYEIERFSDFCTRCKDVGIDVQWLEHSLGDFKRLRAANIHTLPELRMALRELVPHLQKKQADDPVLKAEHALVGRKLGGFFPTPKTIISRMLELADIQPGDRILEPSAGKGDILDILRQHYPDTEVIAIELNGTLFDVLEAKGHNVNRGDFLEHQGEYDRVLMNPPFEKSLDIEHVRHAFSLLAPHGTLVAIMSEGPFFRNDSQATEFRNWLNEVGGESEQLPEDAFNSSEAFRKTGVRTRIVTITK
ncbi:hypothetical protein Pan241w_03890 [Gimesia alba]|uniref:Methyltransferase small domain protein n=1 Tax=Gimesia alba TaxID=2527973 RepID=A0A517R969_9PLAN|nr:hypothetical protein [Gimesia alba]QDT40333.1 hypothetical protein Pan241w_03890 [Gimesia alba]